MLTSPTSKPSFETEPSLHDEEIKSLSSEIKQLRIALKEKNKWIQTLENKIGELAEFEC